MMNQRQRGKPRHKTEACSLMAGVDAELRLVAAPGDISNTNRMTRITRSSTINVSESQGSGRIHDANHLRLFAAVTSFGSVLRKKRMPRMRRSAAATTNPTLLMQMHHFDNPFSFKHHQLNLPSSAPTTASSSHVTPSSLPPPPPPARVSYPFCPFFVFL